MSLKILLFVFLASGYVILSAWALDVQSKVDGTNSRDSGVLDKRDLKSDAKFLDPPPEYYRGPSGSNPLSSFGNERDRIRDRDRDGYVIGLQRPPYGVSGVGYDSRYPSSTLPPRVTPAPPGSGNRYGGFQDRIGYGTPPPYGSTSYGYPHSSNNIPYGQPQPIDFPSYHSGPGSSYYPPSSYGSNDIGSFWSKKGFPGVEHFFPSAGPGDYYNYPGKSDLAKSLLVPLIGGAILGITAALVANPALLHLGTLTGKRRRRDTAVEEVAGTEFHNKDNEKPSDYAQSLAYRAYREKKVL